MQNSPGRSHRFYFTIHSHFIFRFLEKIEPRIQALLEKKEAVGFIDSTRDSQKVDNLVKQLRIAIVCYEASEILVVEMIIDTHRIAVTATIDV